MNQPRRGPTPKAESERKSKPIGLRFPPGMLEQIERSQKASGARSLSEEIARRVELSYTEDVRSVERMGGTKTHAFVFAIAETLAYLRELTGHAWCDDPFTFQQAQQAILRLLDRVKPEGSDGPTEPQDDLPLLQHLKGHEAMAYGRKKIAAQPLGRFAADNVLAVLDRADKGFLSDSEPHPFVRARFQRLSKIADGLHPLLERARQSRTAIGGQTKKPGARSKRK